ncbi:hypothetical protein [Clostridium sp. JN-9]|uniref:hypothetical protein n=1 Tax=Clostridium sp. JN-9 TaxID=2507159 RepID=UPI000FFE20F8|nr:hypothetical protein [Clostridium sp. JN-9]QAT38799.1 hypothetical protein EQM05_00070 [Clostridium sp. JN-9]
MLIFNKSKTNLEYNLSVNNINGILQAFSINLVVPFAGLYAKRLNANDTDIALLNSYPAVFCILAVFLGTGLFIKYNFITGNLLFYIPKNNTQRIHLYQIFFAIAFILSLLEVFSFTKHKLDRI